MKNKKMLLSLLAVGILTLSGCGPKTSEEPTPTPQPSEQPSEPVKQFTPVALDVVKSTYANNDVVQAEGVVYGVTKNGFFFADSANAGIFVNMGDNWSSTVKIGSKVQVEAKYSLVSGYCMLKQATVTVTAENQTVPVTAAEKQFSFVNDLVASVSGDYGMLVKLTGIVSEEGGSYVLTSDSGETLNFASNSAAHLATFAGKRVTLEAVVYKTDSSGKWQLVFAGDESDIVDSTLTFADYVELAKTELATLIPAACTGNLVLPQTHSVDSSLTYTWAVKSGTSVTIVENKAVVVAPETDEEVVLTVTIAKGEETQTEDYTITSKAVVEKTVAQFMAQLPLSGDAVKVNGVVVAMGRNQGSQSEPYEASKRYVVIQDATTTDAVPVNYLYSENDYSFEGLSIGDKVVVSGSWSAEKGDTNNPTINAKEVTLASEGAAVTDAKATAIVISTKEQYEDLGKNPDNYTGKLLKFDNPYLAYSTTGAPNPSNWVRFGYDAAVSKVSNRSFATLIGLGNENVDMGWDKHFAISNSGQDGTQFAGDIYAYLVYRSGSYLQLCIPSASYVALDDADAHAAYQAVTALPNEVDSEGQLALQTVEGLTYTFDDGVEGSEIIAADGKVGLALANMPVSVTVKKGEVSYTKTITVVSASTYSLTVGEETNGTTTLSKSSQLLQNEEVTATFTPAEGYVALSYTVTSGENSVTYPAYNKTTAAFKVPGDATVTANYALASEVATFNWCAGISRQYLVTEEGGFTNSSGVAQSYETVMSSITNADGDAIPSSVFGITPITTFASGKWANLWYSKNDYGINLYSGKDAEAGSYSGFTLTSKHKIHSIKITFYGASYVQRATVSSNGTELEGVIEDEAVCSYLVNGNEFTIINNQTNGNNLYMPAIEIVYEAPAAHAYQYDEDSHWASCSACDYVVADTPHEIVNGECVCGYATEKITLVGTTDLKALYKELHGTEYEKNKNDKGAIPAETQTLSWLGFEGTVILRSNENNPKIDICKNEKGAITYTATGKVRITAQLASTGSSNTSSFALKAGDSYVACDQDATKQSCTFPEGSTKLTDAVAGALYALTGVENAYIIHGSGEGIIVTWTVDASAVEGGLKLSLVSPECQAQRDVRVISLTVETIG